MSDDCECTRLWLVGPDWWIVQSNTNKTNNCLYVKDLKFLLRTQIDSTKKLIWIKKIKFIIIVRKNQIDNSVSPTV